MNLQGNNESDKVRFKCLHMTVSTLRGKTGMLVPLEGIVQTYKQDIFQISEHNTEEEMKQRW